MLLGVGVQPAFALSSQQVARFREDGFLAIHGLTARDEIKHLRALYDRLFREKAGYERGLQLDLMSSEDDAAEAPRLLQILNPVELAPELRDSVVRRNALVVAQQLLGAQAAAWFEHAICKPARHGAATPWHQDEAHRNDSGVTYDQISIWLPLQEATVENGCMRYIPGSHRGPLLPHHSPNDDPRIMALECTGEFDQSRAVCVPLNIGDAVVHDSRTLHSANANVTAEPRRAYIMAFRGAVTPAPHFRGYAWNIEKHTPAQARAEAWKNRGGVLGKAARAVGRALGSFTERLQRKAAKLLSGKS